MQLADIDRAAIYAIARQESKFKVNAVSVSGALGLMQLMPTTAREIAAKMALATRPIGWRATVAYNALLGSTLPRRAIAAFRRLAGARRRRLQCRGVQCRQMGHYLWRSPPQHCRPRGVGGIDPVRGDAAICAAPSSAIIWFTVPGWEIAT